MKLEGNWKKQNIGIPLAVNKEKSFPPLSGKDKEKKMTENRMSIERASIIVIVL